MFSISDEFNKHSQTSIRRRLDKWMEDGRTREVIRFLSYEKSKGRPLKLRTECRNGRLSMASKACFLDDRFALGAIISYNKGISQKDFWNCLRVSLIYKKMNTLKLLLRLPQFKKKMEQILNNPPKGRKHPLFMARTAEAVNLLLRAGADINYRDKYGTTALSQALRYKNAEVVKALRENGFIIQDSRKILELAYIKKMPQDVINALYPTIQERLNRRIIKNVLAKQNDPDRQLLISHLRGKSLREKKEIMHMIPRFGNTR